MPLRLAKEWQGCIRGFGGVRMSPSCPVVLLVDDDEMTRGATEAYLSAQGLAVIAVNSAQAALDVLQNKQVNAVVSDFEMPKMNGLQLAAAVRKSHPTLPFFMMSGREAQLEVDPAPFAAWIQKRSSLSMLRDELLLHLSRWLSVMPPETLLGYRARFSKPELHIARSKCTR